jgi:Protein of unknown function (DUF2726)
MLKLILLGVAVLVVFAALAVLKLKMAGGAKRGVYVLKKALFTPTERSFLGVLERALPPGVRVFGKVRLADIFGVQSGLDASARQAARNRIDRKHVDFLLVRADDLAPLAGIELDDKSHEEEDRQARDALVDEVFKSAGLPLLHVPVQKAYDPAELKAKVGALLAPPKLG